MAIYVGKAGLIDTFDQFRLAVYKSTDGYTSYKYIEDIGSWYVYAYIDAELAISYRVEKGTDEEDQFILDKPAVDEYNYVKPVQITDDEKNATEVILDNDGYNAPSVNRLAVNVGQPSVNIANTPTVVVGQQIPSSWENFAADFVKNSSDSPSMIVDGSSLPVEYTFDADAYQDIKIGELRLAITTQDITFDGGSFGSRSGILSNGVLIQVVSGGTTFGITNIRQNEDWLWFPSPAGLTLSSQGPKDVLQGGFYFGDAITLYAGSSDKVVITVRDNLTGGGSNELNYFQAKVFGIKV